MHGQSCVNLIAVGSCQIELPNCEIILREDQGPSRIEHLFLGYLDKCPQWWLGIGRALANPKPMHCQCTVNAVWGVVFELLEVIVLDEVDWSPPLLREVHVSCRKTVPRLLIRLAVDWDLIQQDWHWLKEGHYEWQWIDNRPKARFCSGFGQDWRMNGSA